MKTLIVYYSHGGNNERLAKALQARIECDIFEIEEMKKRSWFTIFLDIVFNRMPAIKMKPFSLGNYDRLICVAPIWAARIAPPLRTFLNAEKDMINRYSFITICGGAAGQKEKIEKQLTAIIGMKPFSVAELWISSLLKGTKNTSKYKVDQNGLDFFENQIDDFIKSQPINSKYEKA